MEDYQMQTTLWDKIFLTWYYGKVSAFYSWKAFYFGSRISWWHKYLSRKHRLNNLRRIDAPQFMIDKELELIDEAERALKLRNQNLTTDEPNGMKSRIEFHNNYYAQ